MTQSNTYFQGKGKKRQLGWFPATYVKLAGGGTEAPVAEAPAGAEDQPTGLGTKNLLVSFWETNNSRFHKRCLRTFKSLNSLDLVISVASRTGTAWNGKWCRMPSFGTPVVQKVYPEQAGF